MHRPCFRRKLLNALFFFGVKRFDPCGVFFEFSRDVIAPALREKMMVLRFTPTPVAFFKQFEIVTAEAWPSAESRQMDQDISAFGGRKRQDGRHIKRRNP